MIKASLQKQQGVLNDNSPTKKTHSPLEAKPSKEKEQHIKTSPSQAEMGDNEDENTRGD
jgi:hypothetical protein